jgi:bifunctional isochorismate lyase/aryl carrier protein
MTKNEFKDQICRILQTDAGDVADTDNLIDHGLDSIRLMALVQRWSDQGLAVKFEELAAYPEINHWWKLVGSERRE